MIKPMTRQLGAVIAAILTIVSLLGASLVNPSVAHAVQTPGYTVSNIVVNNKALAAGQNVRRQLTPMTFDWSGEALNRTPKEGEGFEVAFPPQLQIAGSSLGKLDLIFEGKKIGDCNLSNGATSLISCVFDSGVNDITSKEVKGSGELKVIASTARREAYTADTIDFQVNGAPVTASIPGGIAKAADARYQPSKLSKYSTPIGERNKAVPWSIAFNPSLLAATVPSLGTPGNGNLTYRFIDTMGEGYDYETLLQGNPWTLQMVNSQDNPSMPAKRLADTNGASDPDYPGFSITVTGSGRNREVTVTGPFQPDTNYRLSVPGKLPGTAIPGIAYTNDVRIDGTNETASGTISYIKTAKVILAMRDGYGAVSIVKRVLGPAAASVPTTTKYPVTINFTLPNGKTVADFPEWTDKPAGLNPSDTSGSVTFSEVVAGSFTNVPNTFPAGTTMTFEETPPAVPNIQWNTAKTTFEPKTLTIQEKQQSELSVSNVAQYADGTFQVKKTIADPKPANAPQSVKLFYQCNADSVDGAVKANTDTELTVNTDGTLVDGAVFRAGTECKVTREADADIAGHALKTDGLNTAVTLKEGKVADNIATVTNTYTKQVGSFSVTKVVDADPTIIDLNPDHEYSFNYVCTKDGAEVAKGELKVNGDNTVKSPDIPVGASCTVTEDEASARGAVDNAVLDVKVSGPAVITENTTTPVTVTNKYTRATSSFTVKKKIEGLPDPGAKEFSFLYKCVYGEDIKAGEIKVKGNGETTVEDVPAGSECTVTENVDAAKQDGYTLVVDNAEQKFDQGTQPTTMLFTNVYTKDTGSLSVTKSLKDPDGVAAGKKFNFAYACEHKDPAQRKEGTFQLGAGESTTIDDIAAESTCTITEKDADVKGADLATSGLDSVVIVKGKTHEVTATNDYSAWRGSVELSKALAGSGKDLAAVKDKKFNVSYVCTLGTDKKEVKKGTVEVIAGTPATIDDVRYGATCEFTEDTANAEVPGAMFDKNSSVTSATATVSGKGTTATANLVNVYNVKGKVTLTKAVEGLAAGVDGNKSREYEIEASWKDPQSGDTKTETYKVANGKFAELPELPAHTVITLKEKKPENTAITSWSTPGYTGDPAAAVKDNRDGTATVTIPADGSAVAVTLTNTANVPWWWIFVPLIPAAIIPNLPTTAPGSSGSGSTAPGHTAPAAGPRQNDPAPTQPTKATDEMPVKGTPKGHQGQPGQAGATPKDDAQKSGPARAVQKVLANTGASVIGIIVIAVLLLIAGLVLALRGRRSQ